MQEYTKRTSLHSVYAQVFFNTQEGFGQAGKTTDAFVGEQTCKLDDLPVKASLLQQPMQSQVLYMPAGVFQEMTLVK